MTKRKKYNKPEYIEPESESFEKKYHHCGMPMRVKLTTWHCDDDGNWFRIQRIECVICKGVTIKDRPATLEESIAQNKKRLINKPQKPTSQSSENITKHTESRRH